MKGPFHFFIFLEEADSAQLEPGARATKVSFGAGSDSLLKTQLRAWVKMRVSVGQPVVNIGSIGSRHDLACDFLNLRIPFNHELSIAGQWIQTAQSRLQIKCKLNRACWSGSLNPKCRILAVHLSSDITVHRTDQMPK